MPTAQQQREKLIRLLKELFQLDQPDLDFGFWRIMHAKSKQVSEFLDKDLLATVEEAFGKDNAAKRAELENAYQETVATAKKYGAADPEDAEPVKQAKAALATAADTASAEADVYDHLYRFFERYYDNGDFLSRRYLSAETGSKAAAFAVPYDGREVYLHWANADQYYIKTSEYFTNFSFDPTQAKEVQAGRGTLFNGKDLPALKVHFRVVEATEGEHGNVKASQQQKRFFILKGDHPAYFENGELVVGFEFRPDPEKTGQDRTWQDKRNGEAVEKVLAALDDLAQGGRDAETLKDGQPAADLARQYAAVLRTPAPTDKQPNRPLLARYVAQYTARNTMDYFIHKDLGGFLRRELDFYIKNEIMRLDDIEAAEAPAVETYLGKVKVLRAIAHRLIDFLAQLENFQKKLWLKKKFVVETNWCITLDRIIAIEDERLREALLAEIAANDAQREEWVRLFAIDEIKKDLHKPGYSKPMRVEFLKANSFLVLDTAFFDNQFRARLLAAFHDQEGHIDGMAIHAENFQALMLLAPRYGGQIKCTYIDPPYNTGNDGFIYKDSYQHATWLTMQDNRIGVLLPMANSNSSLFVSIDDNECGSLVNLVQNRSPAASLVALIVAQLNPRGRTLDKYLAKTHEYIATFALRGGEGAIAEITKGEEAQAEYRLEDSEGQYRLLELRNRNPVFNRSNRPNLFYPIYADPGTGNVSLDRTKQYSTEILPRNSGGEDGCWTWGQEKARENIGLLVAKKVSTGAWRVYRKDRLHSEDGSVATTKEKSIWLDKGINNENGKELLRDMFGVHLFDFPKPVLLVQKCIAIGMGSEDWFLDYFAGSGTSAQAVIEANRLDEGSRRYLLVEVADHFDRVLRPRLCKVAYSKDWKDGKPVSRGTGISQMFKYIRLESYEDALNNLAFAEDAERDKAVAASAGLRQDYMLRYMLDVETRGSQSLLNIDAFADPTAYKLKVKKPGSDEYVWKSVDLIETFNYLIGLRVEHMAAPQTFAAKFKREKDPELPKDTNTKLVLDGKLRQDANGPWWFRRVEGWVPQGTNDGREKVLIIWRKLTGDIERDNLVLDEYFQAHRINTQDWEFDAIYVNGSNNLPNLKREDDKWNVRLIEEDFHRLMWDVEDV